MNTLKVTAMVLFCCFWSVLGQQCPASHFDFVGRYALGRQDQLNNTFDKILQKFTPLQNTTYNYNSSTYTINNAKAVTFYYRDSEQKANVLGNDTIVIYGGRVEAVISFQWKKEGASKINGTGTAFGLSIPIIFVKSIIRGENDTFFSYELRDYNKIQWKKQDPFKITRIDPPSISDADQQALSLMLGRISGTLTVCDNLQSEIDKVFSYYLSHSLHDERIPLDGQFDYLWIPGRGKPNVTLPFTRKGIDVKVESEGVRLYYEVQAVNDSVWKCGKRLVPNAPLQPDVYGASQEFISYDFYENVLRRAISQKLLDTDLTKENWESRMFQFYAGDLYEVVEKVQDRYFADEAVNGNCKATINSLKVVKAASSTFNVSLNFDCEMNIKRNKIVDFSVSLQLEVEGLPLASSIDFKLRSHQQEVNFYPYGDYRILKEQLGKVMVSHSLNRLYDDRLFGSEWPLSPSRDYPHFSAQTNFTIVYDSSHISPTQSQDL